VPGLWNRARTQPRLARVSLGKQQLYDGGSYGLRPMNGYKLIYGGYARHCRDLDEAARHLLDAREKGREARFRVCESLTRDRQPTVEELRPDRSGRLLDQRREDVKDALRDKERRASCVRAPELRALSLGAPDPADNPELGDLADHQHVGPLVVV
jgi:hypothetical protein